MQCARSCGNFPPRSMPARPPWTSLRGSLERWRWRPGTASISAIGRKPDQEYSELAAQMRARCTQQRRPPAQRDLCYDQALEDAWVALENSSTRAQATRACAVAKTLNERFRTREEVRSNLAGELVRSRERQVDLRREAREIARALRTLDQREQSGGDCRK